MDHKDLCEHTRIRLIAAAIGLQQCTKTASNIIPLPGTDRVIAIGTPTQVRGLLAADMDAAPAADEWTLAKHLRDAHALIENTEAFGHSAGSGILECGGVRWNIDDSKAALADFALAQQSAACRQNSASNSSSTCTHAAPMLHAGLSQFANGEDAAPVSTPAQAVDARADIAAWMTEDGERVVPAKIMEGARRDGGAMLSTMKPYSVALVRATAPEAAHSDEPLYSPKMYRRIVEAIGPLPLKGPTVADFVRELVGFYHEAMAARRALGFLPSDAEVTPEEIERTIKSVAADMLTSRQNLASAHAQQAAAPASPHDVCRASERNLRDTILKLQAELDARAAAVSPSDAKGKSIDTPEFQRLAEYWRNEPYGTRSFENAWAEMIAHIDAKRNADAANAGALDTVAWLIEWKNAAGGERRIVALHNFAADVRAQHGNATVTELVPRAATSGADAKDAEQTQAARDVLDERLRQVEVEGWTAERDDKYTAGELARAAATYAIYSHIEQLKLCGEQVWPWHPDRWKRGDYRRDLVKAGALILAEIERVDRDRAACAERVDSEGGHHD